MAVNIETIINKARNELKKIIGLEPSSVIGTSKDEKGWHVSIEMVEKKSIPDQMDILATYEVLLDENGTLLNFERKALRKRIDTAEKE